ncbi:hypothetical protein [Streptomyces sp. NBC_00658]|uniref:hypothetical protein n=1 Tax=Streptomyces sp. NBC_00658 TaxID=2975800 RepID=UPI00324AE7E0
MDRTRRCSRRFLQPPKPRGSLIGGVVIVIVIVVSDWTGTDVDTALQTLTALVGLAAALLAIPERAAGVGADPAGA